VRALLALKTQHIGPEEVLVAAKVELAEDLSFREVVRCIDAAEAQVRRAVPMVTEMYIEPDDAHPGAPPTQTSEA